MIKTQNHVKVEANRCPYCRDDVQAEDSVVCQDCLTRHHEPCWQEAGRCSSCSSDTLMRAEAPPDRQITDADLVRALKQAGFRESEIKTFQARLESTKGSSETCFAETCQQPARFYLGEGTFHGCQEHVEQQLHNTRFLSLLLTWTLPALAVLITSLTFNSPDTIPMLGISAVLSITGFACYRWNGSLPKEPIPLGSPQALIKEQS